MKSWYIYSFVIFCLAGFFWIRISFKVPPFTAEHETLYSPRPTIDVWQHYYGEYFALQYPGSVDVYTKENAAVYDNHAVLEFWRFNQIFPSLQFVAQVLDKGDIATFDEFSSVAFRKNPMNGYTESESLSGGFSGIHFFKLGNEKEEKSEFGSFFLLHDRVYSFVVTALDPNQGKEIFDLIMASLVLRSF